MMKSKKMTKKGELIVIIIILTILFVIASFISKYYVVNKGDTINSIPTNVDFDFLDKSSLTKLSNNSEVSDLESTFKKYEEDLSTNKYTLENAKVVVNPFNVSPLSCLIMFDTEENLSVSVKVVGRNNNDLVSNYESSKNHIIPLNGLYVGNNTVVITLSNGNSKTISIDTSYIDNKANVVTDTLSDNGIYYVSDDSHIYGYDIYGNLRYYLNNHGGNFTITSNSHLLVTSNHTNNAGYSTGYEEIDLLGYVYNIYNVDGGVKDNIVELSTGDLLICGANNIVYLISRSTGLVINSYNISDILSSIDSRYGDTSLNNINYIAYDNSNSSILLSLNAMSSIISINSSDSSINYIIGRISKWSSKMYKYIAKNYYYNFIYPSSVSSMYVSDSKLVVFNTGINDYSSASCNNYASIHSSGVVYLVDTSKMSVSMEYKYNKIFSYEKGSFNYNNRTFGLGNNITSCNEESKGIIYSLDDNNNVIYELDLSPFITMYKGSIYNYSSYNYKDINNYFSLDSKFSLSLSEDANNYYNINKLDTILELYNNIIHVKDNLSGTLIFLSKRGIAYKYNINEYIDISNIPKEDYYIYYNIDGVYYKSSYYVSL